MDEFASLDDVKMHSRSLKSKRLFRGEPEDYRPQELMPSIGRIGCGPISERLALNQFWGEVSSFFEHPEIRGLFTTDIDRLCLAQHYRCFPTRLLDWSSDLKIAVHFACCEPLEDDGYVWILEVPSRSSSHWFLEKPDGKHDLFSFNELKIHVTQPFADEISFRFNGKDFGKNRPGIQSSAVTVHPRGRNGTYRKLSSLVDAQQLQRVKISARNKSSIRDDLERRYGINKDTVLRGKLPQDAINERIRMAWVKETVKSLQ